MSDQHLLSNEGLNHLPCGHRHFNNEMYGMNVVGNGSSLPAQPPKLPDNHPQPSVPPPIPSQYQGLNRGRIGSGDGALVNGPCPHCHHMTGAGRSATAPLMDRPMGLDVFPPGVEGARNPYMALVKTNTCPTPGTPPAPIMCKCHSKPLNECRSASGSLNSDRERNHTQAADTLNDTARVVTQDMGDNVDTPEDPYYFKMETAVITEEVPSPQSPRYFKLEDAETLPLDSEVTPMLSTPDSNGNNVHTKPIPVDKDYTIAAKQPSVKSQRGQNQTTNDNTAVPIDRTASQYTANPGSLQLNVSGSGTVEGLPDGEYMSLMKGKSTVTTV